MLLLFFQTYFYYYNYLTELNDFGTFLNLLYLQGVVI